MADDRAALRAAFAARTVALAGLGDAAVEAAFAAVPREAFLEGPPWPKFAADSGYVPTSDPAELYSDALFAIRADRGLHNGQPSLHARLLYAATVRPGDHVVHIGTGAGYYTAILAVLAGPEGRVTGIEFDPGLAEQSRANLAPWPWVDMFQGDGARVPFAPADVIYVNAGATRPADAWLDCLKDGGRLILPLTARLPAGPAAQFGGVLKIVRTVDAYAVDWISPVAIFPCAGNRDEASERVLSAALGDPAARDVRRLRREPHAEGPDCLAHGAGWCLAR